MVMECLETYTVFCLKKKKLAFYFYHVEPRFLDSDQ